MSKNIFGLKLLHIVTVVVGIIMAVLFITVEDCSNWVSVILALHSTFLIICSTREKEDELARENMGKAQTVVLWVLIAALAVLYMKGRYSPVPANYYLIIISGAIALRSGMFLMFDSTAATAEDDE